MKVIQSRKGLSILELVIALAILGIISVGFVGFFTDSFKFQAINEHTSTLQRVAEEVMENLKNNQGVIDINGITLRITGLTDEGEITEEEDENYLYRVRLNSIIGDPDATSTGIMIYDITVEVMYVDSEIAMGSIDGTVKVNKKVDLEQININYYANGVVFKKEEIFQKGNHNITIHIPTKAGYDFRYWATGQERNIDENGEIVEELHTGQTIKVEDDINLYAQWEKSN